MVKALPPVGQSLSAPRVRGIHALSETTNVESEVGSAREGYSQGERTDLTSTPP